jgi:dTDP-4-dehydrorhamnose 3,5-epimerase
MQFEPLALQGAWLVRPEKARDERGFFARTVCAREFSEHGLMGEFVQSSISCNHRRGTVRGMHFQWPPSREVKLVRCVRGSVHDVLLDLRPASATFMQHQAVRLDDVDDDAVYIPAGFAHGYQTLSDNVLVEYQMTDVFQPHLADGFRWNDPAFGIVLPAPVSVIAARDAEYPAFDRSAYVARFEAARSTAARAT